MTPTVCKAARALTGLTQRELAEIANIATPTIADFERGARQPHLNNLKAISVAFESLGLSFIMEGERMIGIDFRKLSDKSENFLHPHLPDSVE